MCEVPVLGLSKIMYVRNRNKAIARKGEDEGR